MAPCSVSAMTTCTESRESGRALAEVSERGAVGRQLAGRRILLPSCHAFHKHVDLLFGEGASVLLRKTDHRRTRHAIGNDLSQGLRGDYRKISGIVQVNGAGDLTLCPVASATILRKEFVKVDDGVRRLPLLGPCRLSRHSRIPKARRPTTSPQAHIEQASPGANGSSRAKSRFVLRLVLRFHAKSLGD